MLERVDPETARKALLSQISPVKGSQSVALRDALRRVLAEDIASPFDSPPFDRSPLDGFAFKSADTVSAARENPARLKVAGTIYAGSVFNGRVGEGEAVKIMTGAPIPAGADCVIGKENAKDEGGAVLIFEPSKKHDNFIFQGEDIKRGALVFEKGARLESGHIGVLAGMGFKAVSVAPKPRITFFCTGDEIVPPGVPLPPGKIYNSNEALIETRLAELGYDVKTLPAIGDDVEKAVRAIKENYDTTDVFITTGAVSVGDKDIFHEVFEKLGAERIFYRLASRPGNAALCGKYREKLLLCLSGNPFAAILSFELLCRPVLAKLSGCKNTEPRYTTAKAGSSYIKPSGKIRRFVRGKLENGVITFPANNSSGNLVSFAGCNAFADIPIEVEKLDEGDAVSVLLL